MYIEIYIYNVICSPIKHIDLDRIHKSEDRLLPNGVVAYNITYRTTSRNIDNCVRYERVYNIYTLHTEDAVYESHIYIYIYRYDNIL